ncbi:hypothetical protein WH43_13720 [Rheinheimera sp. KL1]|nr:hypothetical protein WH43_13720 [Rheinheimera sp. KL1]
MFAHLIILFVNSLTIGKTIKRVGNAMSHEIPQAESQRSSVKSLKPRLMPDVTMEITNVITIDRMNGMIKSADFSLSFIGIPHRMYATY